MDHVLAMDIVQRERNLNADRGHAFRRQRRLCDQFFDRCAGNSSITI